jgi:hypothetical protein
VFETGTIPRTFGLGETKRATRTSDEASTDLPPLAPHCLM